MDIVVTVIVPLLTFLVVGIELYANWIMKARGKPTEKEVRFTALFVTQMFAMVSMVISSFFFESHPFLLPTFTWMHAGIAVFIFTWLPGAPGRKEILINIFSIALAVLFTQLAIASLLTEAVRSQGRLQVEFQNDTFEVNKRVIGVIEQMQKRQETMADQQERILRLMEAGANTNSRPKRK